MSSSTEYHSITAECVDVRGPRFVAWVTTAVLLSVLVVSAFSTSIAAIMLAGVAGFTFGAPLTGVIATGFALAAAFLNAAFGICLGCQIYPLATRLRYPTANPTQTKGR